MQRAARPDPALRIRIRNTRKLYMKTRSFLALVALALVAAACSSSGDNAGTTTTQFANAQEAEADSVFVRHLQEELDTLGFHAGAVDGVWGSTTQNALQAFQADNGLDETGHYDAETAAALSEAAGEANALTVESLQQKLLELGHYKGLVDGDYGPATESAVRSFQTSEGLAETGTIDHETFLALSERHSVDVEQAHIDAARKNGIGGVQYLPASNSAVPDDYLKQGDQGSEVEDLQKRLAELGYTPDQDGRYGAATASAVLAFQKAENLERDSIFGPEAEEHLANPQAVGPKRNDPGPRVEVDLDRQIMFIIDAQGTVTTVNVSTGSGKEFQSAEEGKGIVVAHTPTGEFIVQRSIDGLREAPLGTLYRPMYFQGGWAIHGNPHVPGYPASHGCVRTDNWNQDFLWTVLGDGDDVWIYGKNPDDPANAAAGA
jgi:peptidoglycan hydrolase-like protein with peptidoglycan-binding domain